MALPLKPFKVVCEVSVVGKLTKGKTYKVIEDQKNTYAISKCDNGLLGVFPKEYFREVQ